MKDFCLMLITAMSVSIAINLCYIWKVLVEIASKM